MRARRRAAPWLTDPRAHAGLAVLLLCLFGLPLAEWLRWLPVELLNLIAALFARFRVHV